MQITQLFVINMLAESSTIYTTITDSLVSIHPKLSDFWTFTK